MALADRDDWQAALAGAVLMAPPLRAPLLLTDQGELPGDTAAALDRLRPRGAPAAANAQAIRLAAAADPGRGLRTASIAGADPYTLAANVAEYRARIARRYSRSVVVVPADDPAYAMPAAAWAAKSGDPVLFTARTRCPPDAARAACPRAPARSTCSARARWSRAGSSARSAASAPSRGSPAGRRRRRRSPSRASSRATSGGASSIPGHGLVVADPRRPLDAGSAAPLSSSGSYGPLLLAGDDGGLPRALGDYLRDIRPGYSSDPVRGVYNRAWIVGGTDAISAGPRARSTNCSRSPPSTAAPPHERSRRPRPQHEARRQRRGRARADGRLDAALRAPAPQPDRAPDRAAPAPTTRRGSRASGRSRGSTRSASPASSAATAPSTAPRRWHRPRRPRVVAAAA